MASGDHILRDPLAEPAVEHEILPDELDWQAFGARPSGIFDYAAVELVDVLKAMMQ